MRRLFLLLLSCTAALSAGAQESSVRMPTFYRFDYAPSRRDPILDPRAPVTRLDAGKSLTSRDIAVGDVLSQFIEPILNEMRKKLVVGGIMAQKGGQGSALISGIEFSAGDVVLLPVPAEVARKVLGVAATHGLPVQYRPNPNKPGDAILVLTVSEITPKGVRLKLPGFRTALPLLRYDPQLKTAAEPFGE